MRRLLLAAGATLGLLVAPAWGATSDVSVKNDAFTPAAVTINPGDTVTWTFNGTDPFDLDHTVTSDSGQPESFDSDPGTVSPVHMTGDQFSHTFNSPGVFTYHCKVHSFMHGKVTVLGPGGTPPPDTQAPKVSGLTVKGGKVCPKKARQCKKRATRISFRSNEGGTYRVTFKRSGGGRSPSGVRKALKKGANTLTLSTKRVPKGRYTLTLVATDKAGNA